MADSGAVCPRSSHLRRHTKHAAAAVAAETVTAMPTTIPTRAPVGRPFLDDDECDGIKLGPEEESSGSMLGSEVEVELLRIFPVVEVGREVAGG